MIYVKPSPGLKVRDPASRLHLPPEGKRVAETSYWIRRIKQGDVVLVTEDSSRPVEPLAPVPALTTREIEMHHEDLTDDD
jgi:hypothetical protein